MRPLSHLSLLSHPLRSAVIPSRGCLALCLLLLGTPPASAGLVAWWPFSSAATVGNDAARGIALSYGPDTNAATTADHAVALLLGIVRNLGALDRRMRLGGWKHPSDEPPALSGKRLGLAGVGRIGQGIGQRCEAGFGMEVAYFSRRRRPELAWTHMGELAALAAWCDFLVLALPGDADTHHIVNSAVLKALGPAGYLVNIGRGALVDTQALTVALREHQIAGAALDVFEDEPRVSAQLLLLDNVLLSPHLAGRSPEAQAAMARLLAQNLAAHFGGRPLSTPIPA